MVLTRRSLSQLSVWKRVTAATPADTGYWMHLPRCPLTTRHAAKFFTGELEQYLILAREEDIDVLTTTGSYAGAMGYGQFIPSSYRHYAVDFDGDGKRDLWNNKADIIGSVANYFHAHGWTPGTPCCHTCNTVTGNDYQTILDLGYKPNTVLDAMRHDGITPP